MNEQELKSCAHCGSNNIVEENDVGPDKYNEVYREWIECEDCGATCKNKESWNMRYFKEEHQ